MNRRIVVYFFATLIVLGVNLTEAQQTKKVPRIGYLAAACPDTQSARTEAFRQGLRDLGYIEGQKIAIEYRCAEGKPDRLRDLAAELIQLKLDLIVTAGNEATQAAKNATGTIPLITTGSDPVVSGFVANLAHPGGNITGVSIDAPGLSGKRLELLKESVPNLSRVAVLYYPATPSSKVTMVETEQAARLLKLHLQPAGVETSNELENAFSAMIKERAEALIKLPSAVLTSYRKRIVELAAKSRLPAMYEDRIIAEDGGLMSYGPDITDLYHRAATYVDKILKGVKPGDLPVEQPTKFEFVINLKAAKQIGLTIPPNVLGRADRVIK
jgi:putative tryptophan/tyrosine transport system substrate-binding protein